MIKGKYFTVEVLPLIPATKQALGAFADGDLLFDWTEFDIPSGAAKLVNATIMSKSADGTQNSHALNLFFAKANTPGAAIQVIPPVTLGTIHATAGGRTSTANQLIGACQSEEVDQVLGIDLITIQNLGHGAASNMVNLVLQGDHMTGDSVNTDKLYVAGISVDGTPNFASTVTCTGVQPITQSVLTVGTTNAQAVFASGDVLHDENDRALGTVKNVNSTTVMNMTTNLLSQTVGGDDVYCINPIRLILQFER